MDRFVEEEQLSDTFTYLDNITIGGRKQKEHVIDVERFLAAAGEKKQLFERCFTHGRKTSIRHVARESRLFFLFVRTSPKKEFKRRDCKKQIMRILK